MKSWGFYFGGGVVVVGWFFFFWLTNYEIFSSFFIHSIFSLMAPFNRSDEQVNSLLGNIPFYQHTNNGLSMARALD